MKKIKTNPLREKSSIFSLFLLASLLLHLLAGVLLQNQLVSPEPSNRAEQTAVRLQERRNWLELDQTPPPKTVEAPKNATHIAENNLKVTKETTPEGDDSRDQQKTAQQKPQQKSIASPAATPPKVKSQQVVTSEKDEPAGELNPQTQVPVNLPNLFVPSETLARIDQQERKKRSKYRPEVELKGDEVWLNLRQENDKLISFFRRFSDRVEAVWNYPVEAASQGVEGTLLIKIIVNKKGELIDAFPMESSGSEILDYEAITAVYRAAPFGKLPSGYKYDQLKIYAHFQYNLTRSMIYGQ